MNFNTNIVENSIKSPYKYRKITETNYFAHIKVLDENYKIISIDDYLKTLYGSKRYVMIFMINFFRAEFSNLINEVNADGYHFIKIKLSNNYLIKFPIPRGYLKGYDNEKIKSKFYIKFEDEYLMPFIKELLIKFGASIEFICDFVNNQLNIEIMKTKMHFYIKRIL